MQLLGEDPKYHDAECCCSSWPSSITQIHLVQEELCLIPDPYSLLLLESRLLITMVLLVLTGKFYFYWAQGRYGG
jgi:hypothetical protein